ncbi:MAG TPA: SMP-30/gluconolactonase/LRE family protein [Allosphingosinicella sp.]|nr:SMP-30/gluconolactonase/LRE family protein [Allosphingosinicella sp.]
MGNPTSVWPIGATLGEGPVWVERDDALWFTDIKQRKIHRFDPASGGRRTWSAPSEVGFLLPAGSGGFVAGLENGLYHFDERTGAFSLIAEVEPELPGNRLNDGVTDPFGRLWFGTMDNGETSASGSFYRFEGGRVIPTGLRGIAITNGPALSPDGRILYWVDTLANTIGACHVASDGTLGPSREFLRLDPSSGHIDGPSVDSEGCLWIGLFGGWEARRYSPGGELVRSVRFPTANITKVVFGGRDRRTGYATTARHLLRPEQLESQPEAGDLFEFAAQVPGIPCTPVALEPAA